MDCRQIESLLPPYVDGEADPGVRRQVDDHLAHCAQCRSRAGAERTARFVVRARAAHLAAVAPPGLRTRLQATLAADEPGRTRLGWRGRLTAFAAAAAVLVVIAAALELVRPTSNVLFAAQLALDHMRCFVVELTSTAPQESRDLSQHLSAEYGWSIVVPPSNPSLDLTLVAARRCPFWLGPHAHLLYRTGGREVSLYVTPGDQRPADDLRVLGHVERLWPGRGASYTLVARGVPEANLERIASYLEGATRERLQ